MAKITPIDVIKGTSGKYGGNSNDYFATKTPFSAFILLENKGLGGILYFENRLIL